MSKTMKIKLPEYLKRVITEAEHLENKLDKLKEALDNKKFTKSLGNKSHELLLKQYEIMLDYFNIIQQRIGADALKIAKAATKKKVYAIRVTRKKIHVSTSIDEAIDSMFSAVKKKEDIGVIGGEEDGRNS